MTHPPIILRAACAGRVRPMLIRGDGQSIETHQIVSGIHKTAITSPDHPHSVMCGTLGLHGDEQADLSVHGGIDKAVYCYPVEHYAFWKSSFSWLCERPDDFGMVGENLCIEGILESEIWIGDALLIGKTVRLKVTKPREPCYKFNAKMRSKHASKLMAQNGFCGWYAQVIEEGPIQAGDTITVVPGPRDTTVADEYRRLLKG